MPTAADKIKLHELAATVNTVNTAVRAVTVATGPYSDPDAEALRVALAAVVAAHPS